MCPADQKLTIASIAQGLQPDLTVIGSIANLNPFLLWPPDLFALTSRILSITGAYTHVIAPPTHKEWPPVEYPSGLFKEKNYAWTELMIREGQEWRKNLEKVLDRFPSFEQYMKFLNSRELVDIEVNLLMEKGFLPPLLQHYWKAFTYVQQIEKKENLEGFSELFDRECDMHAETCKSSMTSCINCNIWNGFEALMSLHAIADEACAGWGIRSSNTMRLEYLNESGKGKAQEYAEKLLVKEGTMATIYKRRGRVLPKRHTPGVGITLRSLSANLAFHSSSVEVSWCVNSGQSNHLTKKFSTRNFEAGSNKSDNDNSLIVLLFPWPFDIHSSDFKHVKNNNINVHKGEMGFFVYEPDDKNDVTDFTKNLKEAIALAKNETPNIDLIILPESALGEKEFEVFIHILQEENIPAYIAGKREIKPNNEFYENIVTFNMATVNTHKNETKDNVENTYLYDLNEIKQGKHHRWKLDSAQVIKYNLGHVLSPKRNWWEAINIKKRVVNFINIGEEITICPLICEDLARQDPIADLIRTVAPSLVVTILMDGPQILERWSAKYASVLAEDPGCLVINLSSWGMVKRGHQRHGTVSHSIALISDCKGKAEEIEMQENQKGVLVSLYLSSERESLADGRVEDGYANNLTIGSICPLIPTK